ncbi:hypothetical protein, partial [Streptomyces showdoensis]|uniref:hypothetical protein n=1 Tax=Streptomyces showdoensis TaxID=68268 RepID=UPI00062C448D
MQRERHQAGGIPDGLVVGLLALLIGLAVLIWTATGLSALFTHGGWPPGVTFARTPQALRSLMTAPTDLPAAWPGTPATALPGYGLFWGLAIGEAMILAVLTVFTLGTLARWKAVRANRRAGGYEQTTTAGRGPGPERGREVSGRGGARNERSEVKVAVRTPHPRPGPRTTHRADRPPPTGLRSRLTDSPRLTDSHPPA